MRSRTTAVRSRAMFVAALAVYLLPRCATAEEADPLAAFMRRLRDAERRLANLKVVGKGVIEARDGDKWVETTVRTDVTAWFNGMAGGPQRVDVARDVIPWEGDEAVAPFSDTSYVAAFDGTRGKFIELKAGPSGKTGASSVAQLMPTRPAQLAMGWVEYADGAAFSSYFYRAGEERRSLADHLAYQADLVNTPAAVERGARVSVDVAELNGAKVMRVVVEAPKLVRNEWWVDPARGHALLRYVLTTYTPAGDVDEPQVARWDVVDLREAAPGVWYPWEAFYTIPADDDPKLPRRRLHYKAEAVAANDPKFDPAIFDPPVPAFYLVTDIATGKSYRTAPATRELDAELRKAVDEGLAAAEGTAATRPAK